MGPWNPGFCGSFIVGIRGPTYCHIVAFMVVRDARVRSTAQEVLGRSLSVSVTGKVVLVLFVIVYTWQGF